MATSWQDFRGGGGSIASVSPYFGQCGRGRLVRPCLDPSDRDDVQMKAVIQQQLLCEWIGRNATSNDVATS